MLLFFSASIPFARFTVDMIFCCSTAFAAEDRVASSFSVSSTPSFGKISFVAAFVASPALICGTEKALL